LTLTD